ncbi:lysozyme [Pseudoduganella plicata]|uniref:Lysozyme n=1 Tax=Pseudoduganella plicata TaxID=321984 RepID=A0A4P7BAW5_9BURK|nr:glycoside hydrolase family protein [Pseudoduganella plicata]QBQ35163.1 hypothetical protein E1742_02520 [Pseudoduganella plicata]GGZ05343.1 hypothetical protein GCM10007388_43800 [Pseudoduganella plicata]
MKNGITAEQADAIFLDDLAETLNIVRLCIQAPLYQHEYDAIVSMACTAGGKFVKFKKLIAKANAGQYSACCAEFADITSKDWPVWSCVDSVKWISSITRYTTRNIKGNTMSRNFIFLTAAVTLAYGSACAAPHELSGTWKFAKNVAYFGDAKAVPSPQYPTIQLVDGKLFLQPRCDTPIDYSKVKYDYDELFQMALKAGADDKAMDKFTKKFLGAPLSSVKYFYQGNKALAQCNFEHANVFILNDKLVLVNGGGIFSAYNRVPAPVAAESGPNLYGRKLSQLPYNGGLFNVVC